MRVAESVRPLTRAGPGWFYRRTTHTWLRMTGVHLVLVATGFLFLLPLLWMVSTSLKSLTQQVAWPPEWIPHPFIWRNYPEAATFLPLVRYSLNSLIITVLFVVGTLLSCPLIAYAFARIRFPGRDLLFVVLIATIMLPGVVRLIPTYLMFRELGFLNTYLPMVLPAYFGSPLFIFLLRQYFRTFPEELADAARMDGASEIGILYRIFMPMSGPALAVITIFAVQSQWNDFMDPLIYLNKEEMRTLAVGLYYFRAYQDTTNWGQMMAAATMMTTPILILFALFQRYFIQGIALTGMKG